MGNESDLDSADDVDLIDVSTTSQVVAVAGQSDVALQLLEQSPPSAALDWAIWSDVSLAYDSDLEQQLTYGTGASGQLLGVTQLSGINSVTYTDASPTGAELYPYLGQAGAQLADALKRRPEVWLMRFARWTWLAVSVDSQGRPLLPPNDRFAPTAASSAGPASVGTLFGVPVATTESIPATSGTGGNQDQIIACKPSDIILWESEPRTMVGTEVLSGTLQARITMRNYVAAIVGRYPSGVSVVSGSGLAVQSGW